MERVKLKHALSNVTLGQAEIELEQVCHLH